MNPLASPPYSTDSISLASLNQNSNIDPQMRALLAATWQVLDQPPPPSLREILAAYKQRGDGDREMLLAMLNAKSAEDQRLASVASLHRAMIESRHIGEPSPPPITQLQLPNGVPYPPPQNHYMHPPGMSYTPPPPPQQADYSPRLKQQPREVSGPSSASSSKASLPSIRGRPTSSRPSASSSEPRQRKRARNSQNTPKPDGEAQFDGHARALEQHPHPHPQHASELPPSPYSSASQRSLSSDGSAGAQHAQKHQRERGAMAIGSLLSESAGGGSSKMDVEREREDGWTNDRARHSSAENSPRLVKAL